MHPKAELGVRIAVAGLGFGGFRSGLLRAAKQSAKERFVHALHISRPEPNHKLI
jgi:hypothetical protein